MWFASQLTCTQLPSVALCTGLRGVARSQSIVHSMAFGLGVWPCQRVTPRLLAILNSKVPISSNRVNFYKQNPQPPQTEISGKKTWSLDINKH